MRARQRELHLYGVLSNRTPLAWDWVEQQLARAGTYWVVAPTRGFPHPRPVWGVWHEGRLGLSLGSPALLRAVREEPSVAVHLDSGTDVVIVEGIVQPPAPTEPALIDAFNRKYDWEYQEGQYGALTAVVPTKVMAWRTAGWAGRDSFQATGCWTFDSSG